MPMPSGFSTIEAAYRQTRYIVVQTRVQITVRIGEASPALDRLLEGEQARHGIFLTAWNPASQPASPARNARASVELAQVLDRLGQRALPTIHLADDPDWTEPGFFILGLALEGAVRLARAYQQNAVVLAEKGHPARLIWTGIDPSEPAAR